MQKSLYAAVSLAALVAMPCHAQTTNERSAAATPPAPTPPSDSDQAAEGDIVVTARLRSETLQNTPASVSVATAASLQNAGVTSALDLARVVPGLVIERTPAGLATSVSLRGLGSTGAPGTFESSVGFFVNGVYLPRSRDFSTSLFDVDRVEVVRGSQGSVLGKNTSLGAVNLITKKPGRDLEGDIALTHEFNFDSWTATGGISVPLSDTLSVRLAGIYDHQGGWVRNLVTGRDDGKGKREAGRATVVWTPTSAFDAALVYEHLDVRLEGLPAELGQINAAVIGLSTLAGFPTLESKLDRRSANSDSRIPGGYFDTDNIDRASLTARLRLGEYEILSQTAYADTSGVSDGGLDYLPGDYFRYTVGTDTSTFSQELRLTSPNDRRFRYVVGGYFGRNTFRQVDEWNLTYPPPLGATRFINFVDQTTTSESVFGQADVDIVKRLTLSGGVRYTHERKETDFERRVLVPGAFTGAFPAYAPFTLSRKENAVDGLVNLRYTASDDLMFYAAWSQGTKSGGFASVVGLLDKSEYSPEVAQTGEVGVRYQTPDRAVTLNATLFSTKVDDYQLSTFNGATFIVQNTDLRSRGVEAQVIWRPSFVSGLRVDVSGTYADTKDTITGGRIPNAPRWNSAATLDYRHPLGSGFSLDINGGVKYESSQTRQRDPNFPPPSDAITKYDASIALMSDAGYSVRVLGRNLSNANRSVFAFATAFVGPGSYLATSEHPRTIALELSYKF